MTANRPTKSPASPWQRDKLVKKGNQLRSVILCTKTARSGYQAKDSAFGQHQKETRIVKKCQKCIFKAFVDFF